MDFHFFRCPHCGGGIQVFPKDIRCKIFRHGAYTDGKLINSHEKKQVCDVLYEKKRIYGCGRPFRLYSLSNGIVIIVSCKYI